MARLEPLPLPAHFLWLLGLSGITLAPHLAHLPTWLVLACGVMLAGQALRTFTRQPPLSGLVTSLLALALATGISLEFQQFLGKAPGLALLAGLLCLKQLESRRRRDLRAAIFLALFLQFGLFFRNQGIPIAVLALFGTWIGLAALVSLQIDDGFKGPARTAGALLLQGLPFMLVLFALFPRVQGPLWGLPEDALAAKTGLSDSMSPGSIGELVQSDAIALRASFNGSPPLPNQRYWRGPVLEVFDGRTWRPGSRGWATQPSYPVQGDRFEYELTLEPLDYPWLLALDFPGPGIPGARYATTFQLLAGKPVQSRQRINLTAYPGVQVGLPENPETLARARQLPPGSGPRSRELAASLAAGRRNDGEILQAILQYFRQGGFGYTLSPPPLADDPVDGFLFDTRRGFCEHFASSFVFLLRAAGVPARVVTGYLGGDINPVDQVMVVRQSDAHAWAEVWLEERGWVRVDPTALAAPRRQSEGLAQALPDDETLPFMLRGDLEWLRDLRLRWEAFNHSWNRWILGYTPDRQREFLSRLGLGQPDWQRMATILAVCCGLLMAGLLAWALRSRHRLDALDRLWAGFCRRLAKRGLPRLPWEGPLAYAARASQAFPGADPALQNIASQYARLRYGPTAAPGDLALLKHAIHTLKLP